jgi:hypothetical protein
MLRKGDWDGISEVTPDPRSYTDASLYARDAAAAGLLRKYEKLPTTHDRRANAVKKWWEGERDCYRANERLSPYLPEHCAPGLPCADDGDRRLGEFLLEVRKVIKGWIGRGPNALALGRFGPGATYSKKGGRTTVPDKMSTAPSLTRSAIWYLPQWLGTQWGSAIAAHCGEISFVPGNRFATVPKTSKTDRAIAAEPDINVFYQLALGRELRQRLKKSTAGRWDLDHVQTIHGQVARVSSVTKEFATLDLSNASDTVSRNLVKVLLPHRWYEQLAALRSSKTFIDGKWVVLEKFSSMGNGFTFELETIIFAAVATVVARQCGHIGILGRDVFVFGDDIIVKNDVYRPLKSVLEFLGFSLNAEKSFFDDDAFRESCGQDFFNGKPVRPYFLKEEPNGPQDYIAVANGLRALNHRLAASGMGDGMRAWFSALDCIPTGIRSCRGPEALGDIVIHDDAERWTTRWRHGIRYLRVYRPHRSRIVSFQRFSPEVVLACATYGTGNRRGGVVPRDGVLSHKVGWAPRS